MMRGHNKEDMSETISGLIITGWYVIVGKAANDRVAGYPLQIYADKHIAEEVAKANNEEIVLVKPIIDISIVPGAICPHCGRSGISGYDKDICLCPNCGKNISLDS